MTKYVFVTGGVVSSLGKGIAAASLGAILESRNLKVTMLKLDPYINVDPGTMSPFQAAQMFSLHDKNIYNIAQTLLIIFFSLFENLFGTIINFLLKALIISFSCEESLNPTTKEFMSLNFFTKCKQDVS